MIMDITEKNTDETEKKKPQNGIIQQFFSSDNVGGGFHMKKTFFLIVLTVLYALYAGAGAEPALTDGTTTGWIAEHNYLYLRSAEGRVSQMPMAMADLLQMTDDELICLTQDQRIIAVKKDGTGSRNADQTEVFQTGRVFELGEEGELKLNGSTVSTAAQAAVQDGTFLYYTEKTEQGYVLRVHALQNDMKPIPQGSREAYAASLTGQAVPEPLSLTVTGEALTLTAADRRVIVMDLTNGEMTECPAAGSMTGAACRMNGTLYRYQKSEQGWTMESALAAAGTTPTAAPTATPSATPKTTATPKPTATARPTATPESYVDEDGTIHRGASGSIVKKIQTRLSELGYPVGKIDGTYGSATQTAINLFCDAINVKEHEYITRKVQKKLFADDAPVYDEYMPLKKGDKGAHVKRMQKRLKELGFDPGSADGVYGKKTVAAVARFQAAYEIAVGASETAGETASRDMLIILYDATTKPGLAPAAQKGIQ